MVMGISCWKRQNKYRILSETCRLGSRSISYLRKTILAPKNPLYDGFRPNKGYKQKCGIQQNTHTKKISFISLADCRGVYCLSVHWKTIHPLREREPCHTSIMDAFVRRMGKECISGWLRHQRMVKASTDG